MMQKNNFIFICQVTQDSLKVIKCLASNAFKREFVGLEIQAFVPTITEGELSERISQVLKKFKYNNYPLIISLSRHLATCRFLKAPAKLPEEIENIISLQASRYLPYPAQELITGYQIVSTDKEGYSYTGLIIVHKDIIERYIRLFKQIKLNNLTIALSSYGLCNLYSYIHPEDNTLVMLIDIDAHQVESVITLKKKVLFSRSFKLNRLEPQWQKLLINGIHQTQDAYIKETSGQALHRIIILDKRNVSSDFADILTKEMDLPVEVLSYNEKISFPKNVLEVLLNSDNSCNSLIGLGLSPVDDSLNLAPLNVKEERKKIKMRERLIKKCLFITGIALLLGLGTIKNLDNKAEYLKELKAELNKINKDARPLEEIVKRSKYLESRLKKKPTALEIIYALYQHTPAQVYLETIIYEEDNQIILHGQTTEINSVFKFVEQLEKSAVFKNFNLKVRYLTKKRTQSAEFVDFEIVCAKK